MVNYVHFRVHDQRGRLLRERHRHASPGVLVSGAPQGGLRLRASRRLRSTLGRARAGLPERGLRSSPENAVTGAADRNADAIALGGRGSSARRLSGNRHVRRGT